MVEVTTTIPNKHFYKLLEKQNFSADDLDYSLIEQQKPIFQKLADISQSVISVFDLYQRQHIFHSSNAGKILGYSYKDIANGDRYLLDRKINPEDAETLQRNAFLVFKMLLQFPDNEKLNYKLVSEYRILNAANKYIRVIEQQQVLELDNRGNIWLSLSILDISPNQENMGQSLKNELLNFKTGKIIQIENHDGRSVIELTKRETEVLKLVKKGFLSKEIAGELSISLNTVNTHRQKVLEKLGVNNSMEAVMLASKLDLI